jgi:hypothetical protein
MAPLMSTTFSRPAWRAAPGYPAPGWRPAPTPGPAPARAQMVARGAQGCAESPRGAPGWLVSRLRPPPATQAHVRTTKERVPMTSAERMAAWPTYAEACGCAFFAAQIARSALSRLCQNGGARVCHRTMSDYKHDKASSEGRDAQTGRRLDEECALQ